MIARVVGLETEYGLAAPAAAAADAARMLFVPPPTAGQPPGSHFLPNGARFYLDIGAHPEYATPEVVSLVGLLCADRAGDELLAARARAATGRLGEADGGPIRIIKNNTDREANTYGCHENYLIARDVPAVTLARHLAAHLATRVLFCGSGRVHPDGTYELSQRARHMTAGAWTASTTRGRGFVSLRDEPHATAARWQRLHVIAGDANMAETSTWLKVGTTHLVLRLLTEPSCANRRVLDGRAVLDNPAAGIVAVSAGGPDTLVRRADLRTMRAVEVQLALVDAVADHLDETGATGEEQAVLTEWARVLADLGADPDRCADRIDWVAKRRVLDGLAARRPRGWSDPVVAAADLAYHDVDPARSIARRLETAGLLVRRSTPADVDAAGRRAPDATRARLRGAFVAAAEAAGVDYTVGWSSLVVHASPRRGVELGDPFAAADEAVEALIAAIAAPARGDPDDEPRPGRRDPPGTTRPSGDV